MIFSSAMWYEAFKAPSDVPVIWLISRYLSPSKCFIVKTACCTFGRDWMAARVRAPSVSSAFDRLFDLLRGGEVHSVQRYVLPASPFRKEIHRFVGGDPVEPGRQSRTLFQGTHVLPRFDQRVLQHVVRIVVIDEHTPDVAVKRTGVLADECFESLLAVAAKSSTMSPSE